MTFPASFYTPQRIIPLAMKDAGLLQQGSTPTAEFYQDGLHRLADMIAAWQTQGLKLWLNSIVNVTLLPGVATYTLGPGGSLLSVKPLRVIEGWCRLPNNSRYPLTPLSWNEYRSLGNLQSSGAVNSYFVDKQQNNLAVFFWNVPDASAASSVVELLVQRQATGPTQLSEDMGFPTEWYLALRWGLADELATGQPEVITARCAAKAREYRTMLEDWDVEDASTRFQVDGSQGGRTSRFR